jgi:hypothetical protein
MLNANEHGRPCSRRQDDAFEALPTQERQGQPRSPFLNQSQSFQSEQVVFAKALGMYGTVRDLPEGSVFVGTKRGEQTIGHGNPP